MSKKYIKSKSLYTIKELHAKTSGGTIFENDHVTIIPNDGLYNETMPLFSDSNFLYKISSNDDSKKKHVNSTWIKPENSENNYWTMNDVDGEDIKEESKIILKPDYSSLRDFAYYGSAVELIKYTINDIILRFPGGISFYKENPLSMWDNDIEYFLVSNDFNIDCWTEGYVSSDSIKNPMRVLAASYKDYVDGNNKELLQGPEVTITGSCINSIIGTTKFAGIELKIYLGENGEKYLVYNKDKHEEYKGKTIIKPKQYIIDKFWNTLDDFERVLLNRNSSPIYRSEFETPYSNETGFYYKIKSYIWPTVNDDGFTPDITTGKFQNYLQSLMTLAEFHDEYDSDNIWRMMTHEAIKNLDWTFTSKDGEVIDDTVDIDSGRIKVMSQIQGRLYDDLKRNISVIKSTNNISYNQKDNIPDYFLSDNVDNHGWVGGSVSNFNTTTDDISINDKVIETSRKDDSYVNSAFLRRLSLSSNYIFSMKGTRRGLESILGMFGYSYTDSPKKAGEYSLDEYYVEATGTYPNYCDAVSLRVLFDYVNADEITNFMNGYPVANVITESNPDGYLIPWFNNNMKYKHPIYFQSKGGWGKVREKYINKPELTTYKKITGENFYLETSPYLLFVKNINEMLNIPNSKLYDGLICYVEDISNYYDMVDNKDYVSHYFVLKNNFFSGFVDKVKDECYGWVNVKTYEFDGTRELTEIGKQILNLETIVTEEQGNNSHTGKGKYDDGSEYFSYFTNIFGKDIEDGVLSKIHDEEDIEKIKEIGFNISGLIKDNKKCYFFGDYIEGDDNNEDYEIYKFYNPEQKTRDRNEESANSVINTKHLTLRFNTGKNSEMKQYIKNVVLRYVFEMVPSTTIIEILFDDEETAFQIRK